jgi:hypothetical protein
MNNIGMKSLKKLTLSSMDININLFSRNSFPLLTHLELINLLLESNFFIYLSEIYTQLIELKIYFTRYIDDQVTMKIIEEFKSLRLLDLSCCKNITSQCKQQMKLNKPSRLETLIF